MVYLLAHIKLRAGKVQKFTEMLGALTPLVEKHDGWKLQGSYYNVIGRLDSVVDVWEIPDANSIQTTLESASRDPEFHKWVPVIQECIEDETFQVMSKLQVLECSLDRLRGNVPRSHQFDRALHGSKRR